MDNPFYILLKDIINYYVHAESKGHLGNYRKFSTLIRIHSEKLSQCGDVSFPGLSQIWMNYFLEYNMPLNEAAFVIYNGDDKADEEKYRFLKAAAEWEFPIEKLEVRQERIQLYLKRHTIMENLITQCLTSSSYGHLKKTKKFIYLQSHSPDAGSEDLSFYRSQLVHGVLQKLLIYSRCEKIENKFENIDKECLVELQVESVASKCGQNNESKVIKCGLVIDPNNQGKRCQLPVKDYISIRSNDMTLTAMHKYGLRVKQNVRFCALMEQLGVAAVTVDLLEVKHTSPVQVIRNGQGSTKGASFILYNSARLETILRTFDSRIDNGDYDPLIPIDRVQWDLLSEEEEWQLVYAYVAGFPNLIDRCTEQIESGLCSTHLIIHFLNGLVATFSIYYRRIKILTENREQLMPFVYARMYLIKAVRSILNKTLALLNIEPVDFM